MTSLGLADISALIPHRPPFLFVRSAEIVSDNEVHGRCGWDVDNPIFAGHFPAFAMVPAVLMVEAAAQLAGIHVARRASGDGGGIECPITVLTTIRQAFVHRPVFPGEEIDYRVTLEEPVGKMIGIRGAAFAQGGGRRVFKCELVLATVEKASLLAAV